MILASYKLRENNYKLDILEAFEIHKPCKEDKVLLKDQTSLSPYPFLKLNISAFAVNSEP